MHMMDWHKYRALIAAGVATLGKRSPETVKGYLTLNAARPNGSGFDDKTRELIATAVAISLRCDGCIAVHTEAARKFGATANELTEAMAVAIGVNAGAAIIYTTRALDAFGAAEAAAAG